jgi:DNA-directed RNA polymerase subunit M/transcription elongation factor TFIIS
MILSKIVNIIPNSKHFKYYESLGYNIPKHFNKSTNKMVVKHGTKIEVKVEHLTKGSHVKVLCQCDNCKKELLVYYQNIKSEKYICQKCTANSENIKKTKSNRHKGKIISEETKKKMKEHSKMIWKGKYGINHPAYKKELTYNERLTSNDRSLIPGYYQWQHDILERDNFTCQYPNCNSHKNLRTHHLNSYAKFPKLRVDLQNGITLCENHHKKFHHIYGQVTTKELFDQFQLNPIL